MGPRIAVLGCGSIGRRHARNLRKLGYDRLVLFDPDEASTAVAMEETDGTGAAALEDVWRFHPDVAFITAPSALHVSLALEAARRGCHVFVEKPLSHSLRGIEVLEAEIERQGRLSMVACNMRFHPGPATVKRLIEDGAVGRVLSARLQSGSYLPRWRPGQDYRESYSASPESGGAILDVIHEIDLALWYFGPASVVGAARLSAASIGLETDGLAEILLLHTSGSLSSVHLNFVQRDYRRTAQVIGSEGTIYWDYSHRRIEMYDAEGELFRRIPEPEGWESNQMYVDEVEHFMNCVLEGRATTNPLGGGVETLEVALVARSWGPGAGT